MITCTLHMYIVIDKCMDIDIIAHMAQGGLSLAQQAGCG
jgi:hypothetical protein